MKYESMPRAELIEELNAWNSKFNSEVSNAVAKRIEQKENEFIKLQDKYEQSLKDLYVSKGYELLSSAYFSLKTSKPNFVWASFFHGKRSKYNEIESAANKLKELLESISLTKK